VNRLSRGVPARLRAPATIALIVAAGAAVRLLACRGDLWLDEVWTLALLDRVHSPLGVLTEIPHANNHVLNTLFAYAVSPLEHDALYRAPAWLGGVLGIALGARLAWLGDGRVPAERNAPTDAAAGVRSAPTDASTGVRSAPTDGSSGTRSAPTDAPPGTRAVWAAAVLAGSYLLVLYGSEARGYALSIAFLFAALAVVISDDVAAASRRAPAFWLASVLAVLCHPLALHGLVAALAWSALRVARRPVGWAERCRTLLWWNAPPAAAVLLFYLGFLRAARATLSGPTGSSLVAWTNAIAMAAGLPSSVSPVWTALLGATVLGVGVLWLWRRGSDLWILFAVGVVGSPALLALLESSELVHERFFLVAAALWLLLGARLLAAAWHAGGAWRVTAVLTLAGFLVGNAFRIERLLGDQRGHYQQALRHVLAESPGPAVTLASDHDFRNGLLVAYHRARVPSGERLRYVPRSQTRDAAPEWLLQHRLTDGPPPPRVLREFGRRYVRESDYPATPPSGFHWFLYRRVDRAAR
jgi:hypothetical protein